MRFDWSDEQCRTTALARPEARADVALAEEVRAICEDVRARGWDGLVDRAQRIDGTAPVAIDIAPFADRAERELAPAAIDAMRLAAANIDSFHRQTKPQDIEVLTQPGLSVAKLWRPLDRAGLYVPGGRAGGTMLDGEGVGYCSDITRCLYTGEPAAEVRELYAVLQEAHRHAVTAATVGTACEAVDAAARDVIVAAGLGEFFVHRTGHGIGVEAHEDPYIVAGNSTALVAGHAFSIEPGIYLPERFGARLEDIVVATERGPEPLNVVDHGLLMVEA